jgi:Tfp pilus assembly protein FimT
MVKPIEPRLFHTGMPAKTLPSPAATRRAYTLFEIMLVLAIIVAMGAIAAPIFHKSFEIERLRKASDALRTAWAKTRVEAMSTGVTHIFRSQYGTNQYVIAVWDNGESATEASSNTIVSERQGHLPEGIIFYAAEKAAEVQDGQTGQGEGMAPDLFFYPDGTTSTAQVLLANQIDRFVKVGIRGLTGVTEVGEIVASEQLEQ